jgi:hypothetical protein
MTRFKLPAAAICLMLACISSAAQDKGMWRATSSNASKITGDIIISDAKITMNFLAWPLAQIRSLTPTEISAVFDADSNVAQGGNLYRLNISASQRFLHHNTLCGSEQTQWMATYIEGRTLHVAFFSGSNMPVLKFETLQNSTDVCGIFSYSR